MKFASLAAMEVVILTTCSAVGDENLVNMNTFPSFNALQQKVPHKIRRTSINGQAWNGHDFAICFQSMTVRTYEIGVINCYGTCI